MPPRPDVRGAAAIVSFLATRLGGAEPGQVHMTPTRANGRPALAMHTRAADGALVPHGIQVLDVAGDTIAGLDVFRDPALLGVFGFGSARRHS